MPSFRLWLINSLCNSTKAVIKTKGPARAIKIFNYFVTFKIEASRLILCAFRGGEAETSSKQFDKIHSKELSIFGFQ